MLNHYELQKLAEMRHKDDLAAASRWRLALQVAPSGHPALPVRRWLARLGAWLECLGCVLQARYRKMRASPAEVACAC